MRALGHRDYRLFFAGQIVSLIGTWMLQYNTTRGFVGSAPIGALFIGSVAEQLGVLAACAAGGGCGLVAVAILSAWWKWRRA